MKITSAVFDLSAVAPEGFPEDVLPEFAFIGRSNVGKSSLLNAIACRKDLARVSDTPGFTKTVNFFTINRRWRLVDLPGYGFAKVSKSERGKFSGLAEMYLSQRENLACVFVLIDSSIPPQAMDLDFVRWIGEAEKPFALVFTKTDKAKGGKHYENVERFMMAIGDWFTEPPEIFSVSSKKGNGIDELRELMAGF